MKAAVKLLPAILWFALSFVLLTLPGDDLPKADWMDNLPIDKVVHIGMFCILVILFFWGIVSTKQGMNLKRTLIYIAVAALAYGIAMEFVQKYWIPNRSFDIWDIVADGIGSFLPLFFLNKMKKVFKLHLQSSRFN